MRDSDFPIIRYNDFKSNTNAIIGDRKSLQGIDTWLKQYESAGNRPGMQLPLLKEIATACQLYLEKKEKKALSKKPSNLLIKRFTAVKSLIGQVYQRLIYLSYEQRKGNAQNSNGALKNAQRGGLGDFYQFEREHFNEQKDLLQGLKLAKVNPMGAGFIKDQIGFAQQMKKVLPSEIQMVVNKPTNTWTLHDYKMVGKYFDLNTGPICNSPIVHFIRKDERLRHFMLYPDDQKLFGPTGELADFSNSYPFYALDTHGNLIVNGQDGFGDKVKGKYEGGQSNHSSLCAGRSVICAGMIQIQKGFIVHIDNKSGHYSPTPHRLSQAIQVLIEEYDLDLPNTLKSIEVMTSANDSRKFTNYEAFRNVYPPFDN